jgi:Peptidase family M3
MNETEAQKIIKHMDGELETFDRAYEEGRWLKNQGLLSASNQFDLEVRRANILLDHKIQDIVDGFMNTAEDPLFRRVLVVLDRLIKYSKVESNQAVYQVRSKIEQAIVNYPIMIAGKRTTRTDARQILRTEKDAILRQEALHCYDGLSRLVEADLKELVLRRNSIAQEMGYEHFGVLGLGVQGLSRAQLKEWSDAIIQKTDSMYQSFIIESAEKLNQPRLRPQDLSFALTQFKTLPDIYFTSDKLIESIVWLADHLKLSEAVSRVRIDFVDIPFQGLCVTIHVPDVIRILINPSDGHSYYSTFFHEIGHAMHSSHITQPYHLLRDEVGPFCEGMADSMARFVDDPEWLLNWGKIPEEIVKQNKSVWRFSEMYEMRRLISLADFEWLMYADPEADLLNVFQSTRLDNLKVPSQETIAWADNSYWSSYPFYAQNYLVAEMIASQTHLTLRKLFGHVIQPESSTWLAQNYWNAGGSIEWGEKILQATGAYLSPNELILEMTKGFPPE